MVTCWRSTGVHINISTFITLELLAEDCSTFPTPISKHILLSERIDFINIDWSYWSGWVNQFVCKTMIPGKEVPLPQKITGLIGNFPQHWVGGSSQFPKPFYPKKAPISPKQQTKFVHKITQIFFERGVPKRGGRHLWKMSKYSSNFVCRHTWAQRILKWCYAILLQFEPHISFTEKAGAQEG